MCRSKAWIMVIVAVSMLSVPALADVKPETFENADANLQRGPNSAISLARSFDDGVTEGDPIKTLAVPSDVSDEKDAKMQMYKKDWFTAVRRAALIGRKMASTPDIMKRAKFSPHDIFDEKALIRAANRVAQLDPNDDSHDDDVAIVAPPNKRIAPPNKRLARAALDDPSSTLDAGNQNRATSSSRTLMSSGVDDDLLSSSSTFVASQTSPTRVTHEALTASLDDDEESLLTSSPSSPSRVRRYGGFIGAVVASRPRPPAPNPRPIPEDEIPAVNLSTDPRIIRYKFIPNDRRK